MSVRLVVTIKAQPGKGAELAATYKARCCREEVGAGVLDLSLHPPGSGDVGALMEAIDLFGTKALPRIREI